MGLSQEEKSGASKCQREVVMETEILHSTADNSRRFWGQNIKSFCSTGECAR